MSFKREGDDPGQLGVLQKRRVADLLANYIPEDEALLLRSGRPAALLRQEALAPGRGPEAAARAGGAGRASRRAGLPGPSVGTDEEDRPERSAESSSLQQLLPEDGGGGKQLASWRDPDGAECCPDAFGAVTEGRRSRGHQSCSPAAGASRRASGRTEGSSGPDAARRQRKSLIVGPEPARSPQPREAPGPGAIPAAAERRLDPGPLWQVGEGRERRIRLRRGRAARAAAVLRPRSAPPVPTGTVPPGCPQAPPLIEAAGEDGGV
ncbi:sodium channel modifier 1 isoform X1 [Gymnogyps californianus]|uniref:sodium channel modifier 1 isoform X1 n=1 Tax=Gymnogyps californianus TaxID=33616 RepID=UPI0021C8C0B1|nr:sodium channel modifier 1 isoform X1 [Gymnogyps californianus]